MDSGKSFGIEFGVQMDSQEPKQCEKHFFTPRLPPPPSATACRAVRRPEPPPEPNPGSTDEQIRARVPRAHRPAPIMRPAPTRRPAPTSAR
ncbi:hypothetical protein HPP92_013389 [Vanilla planifolia]|uniref:Uncharacterized protein n=1 Tax=Vanilla planifolia TaxID=51239 RepID=A0A835QRL2_VANPL|nr:hypothetical protein HPP92_013389 [Vanilla planifolia]